jgi:signal peptidase II
MMYAILTLAAFILIGLDQWVKHWARVSLQSQPMMTGIPGIIDLIYVENDGISFGMFAGTGGRWVFVALTLISLIAIIMFFIKMPHRGRHILYRIPIMLLFAGAVGNLIDRVAFGYVVDMFAFAFINFPVFNVADICAVVGCFSLILVMIVFKGTPWDKVDDEPN